VSCPASSSRIPERKESEKKGTIENILPEGKKWAKENKVVGVVGCVCVYSSLYVRKYIKKVK
jgi:hypothetical protein